MQHTSRAHTHTHTHIHNDAADMAQLDARDALGARKNTIVLLVVSHLHTENTLIRGGVHHGHDALDARAAIYMYKHTRGCSNGGGR